MKKAIIALLCLALLCGGGYFGYRQYEKSRDEKKIVDVVPVNLMAQPAGMFEYTDSNMWGYISAANAQKVYVDTNKLVKEVFVEQGQEVKKGDTILEYDMTVVELELAQKENQVHVIEQDIKMAQKELAEISGYRPSEDMPAQPEPEIPELPEEPEIPVQEIVVANELTGAIQPVSGSGTAADPFIFNCGTKTVVRKAFMAALSGMKRTAALRVYDEDSSFLYQWIISGEQIKLAEADDWNVTDGVNIDPENGSISIDPEGVLHGQLSFAMPEPEIPEGADLMPDEPVVMPEPEIPEVPDYGNDYMYSRKELDRMIASQESQIKDLEINLKTAQLALETAKKQKSDGKVVATIDGVVKKIGKSAAEADAEPEQEQEQPEEMQDPFAEPSEDDNAFAIIEGAGGVEVVCEVPELQLAELPAGTILNVQSYQNGAFTEAEVTSVEDEPSSYSANMWQANPNSSMYKLHAKLMDSTDFVIGNGVDVSVPQNGESGKKSSAVVLPIHYIRQEGGDYYVMKADENDRLVKQYVSVGKNYWGYYIEVTGGLDVKNDRICFPFGTDVKEGVKTQDSTEVLYPSNY